MASLKVVIALSLVVFYVISLKLFASAGYMHPDIHTPKHSLERYCSAFMSCSACQKASYSCAWCHEEGCVSALRRRCPRSFRSEPAQSCPELGPQTTVSVPANERRIIKFNIRNDASVKHRAVLCEINVEQRKTHVRAYIKKDVVYCDPVVLRASQAVMVGQLRLYWGGAESYSNALEVLVYRCERLANGCGACRELGAAFACGWCMDSLACTTMTQCPRQLGPWLDKGHGCEVVQAF